MSGVCVWVDFTGDTYAVPPDLWARTRFRKDGLLDRRAKCNGEFTQWLMRQRAERGWVST